MSSKYLFCALVALALLGLSLAVEEQMTAERVEDSTESPIADMAMIDAEMKTSTEKPPIAAKDVVSEKNDKKDKEKDDKTDTQRHTVADFIIHPLIAFKPRSPEDETVDGKQASTSTTTPSPWQLFGFNAGQGLGSIAGSVTGWLNDRIQLPGLVDTPVRESTTTSTSTTTTPRPDVVVRVQHRSTTRQPLIAITNKNRPHRFNNNNLNYASDEVDDDDEYDDDDIGFNNNNNNFNNNNNNRNRNRRRKQNLNNNNNNYNDYNDEYNDTDYVEDEEQEDERPNRRRKGNRNEEDYEEENVPNRRRKGNNQQEDEEDEYVVPNENRKGNRIKQQEEEDDADQGEESDDENHDEDEEDNGNKQSNEEASEEQEDDEAAEDDEEEDDKPQRTNNRRRPVRNRGRGHQKNYGNRVRSSAVQHPQAVKASEEQESESEENKQQFYHGSRPSTKRSQSQTNFIQRGQQSLINQIRQLTHVQSPAQIGAVMRKQQPSSQTRRQQATLFINRNGQTVYMAPELLGNAVVPAATPQYHYYPQVVQAPKRTKGGQYPQPPLTKPLKRKDGPTQYITIPWSRLGIAPPDQIVSLGAGLQSEPHILNIPQSAIQAMSNPSHKKKRPLVTSDAVPLLAEASLMDIFQPPQIPASRNPPSAASTTVVKPAIVSGNQVMIATKVKHSAGGNTSTLLPHRIRGGTIVEKAPAMDSKHRSEDSDEQSEQSTQSQANTELRSAENEYILVGSDNEDGLTRQVPPVYGEARYVQVDSRNPLYEVLQRGRFALRKAGRALEEPEQVSNINAKQPAETLIPVQVISEAAEQQPQAEQEKPAPPTDEMIKPQEPIAAPPTEAATVVVTPSVASTVATA